MVDKITIFEPHVYDLPGKANEPTVKEESTTSGAQGSGRGRSLLLLVMLIVVAGIGYRRWTKKEGTVEDVPIEAESMHAEVV